VNLLTAIPRQLDPKRFEAQMAMTNRVRTEGTANLIAAAGNARLVSEGLAYAYCPAGGPVADEDRPLCGRPGLDRSGPLCARCSNSSR
jgi:hypothetical protein